MEDNKTIFLHFLQFVPDSIGSEVSLFQVLDENDNITHEIVLTPGPGFQIKRNGEYETLRQYDSTSPERYLVAINKNGVSVNDDNYNSSSTYLPDIPLNPKIKINSPTVSMPSDW